MDVVLMTFKPDGKRVDFAMRRPTIMIGRGEECAVRIPAASVSRKHCQLTVEGQRVRIKDLGSSNGTYVNGDRIKEVVLGPGDMLTIGHVNFQIQIDGDPATVKPFKPVGAERGGELLHASGQDKAEAGADGFAAEALADDSGGEQPGEGDFFTAEQSTGAGAGDSVGISLDGSAEPAIDDPLAALEMFTEKAPPKPRMPRKP